VVELWVELEWDEVEEILNAGSVDISPTQILGDLEPGARDRCRTYLSKVLFGQLRVWRMATWQNGKMARVNNISLALLNYVLRTQG
jgi:hypothetical protein